MPKSVQRDRLSSVTTKFLAQAWKKHHRCRNSPRSLFLHLLELTLNSSSPLTKGAPLNFLPK